MNDEFPIIDISKDTIHAHEPMGSKNKFWVVHDDLGICLFKHIRAKTGEDWAEKIAAELAGLLQLPHAQYELSVWNKQSGVISPNFLHQLYNNPFHLSLVHGNQVLMVLDPDYPGEGYYKLSQHTLDKVFDFLCIKVLYIQWHHPFRKESAVEDFVGYLILDAWIGNTDRHHENWAFILQWQRESNFLWHLAPTFDHASSLGCHLTDKVRRERLNTNDRNFSIETYVTKARSAFYLHENDQKPITTYEVVDWCMGKYPDYTKRWINMLNSINEDDILNIVSRIPKERMTETAAEFAYRMLVINKNNLIELLRN